jgi:IS1 family transposase
LQLLKWTNFIHISKKTNHIRIWTAVDRNSLCLLAFYVGSGDEIAAKRMWQKINHHEIKFVCTDENYNYSRVLPRKICHVVSKKETCFVESKNSDIRHYIPCFRRKTKAYAKSRDALNRAMKFFLFRAIICGQLDVNSIFYNLQINYFNKWL